MASKKFLYTLVWVDPKTGDLKLARYVTEDEARAGYKLITGESDPWLGKAWNEAALRQLDGSEDALNALSRSPFKVRCTPGWMLVRDPIKVEVIGPPLEVWPKPANFEDMVEGAVEKSSAWIAKRREEIAIEAAVQKADAARKAAKPVTPERPQSFWQRLFF